MTFSFDFDVEAIVRKHGYSTVRDLLIDIGFELDSVGNVKIETVEAPKEVQNTMDFLKEVSFFVFS